MCALQASIAMAYAEPKRLEIDVSHVSGDRLDVVHRFGRRLAASGSFDHFHDHLDEYNAILSVDPTHYEINKLIQDAEAIPPPGTGGCAPARRRSCPRRFLCDDGTTCVSDLNKCVHTDDDDCRDSSGRYVGCIRDSIDKFNLNDHVSSMFRCWARKPRIHDRLAPGSEPEYEYCFPEINPITLEIGKMEFNFTKLVLENCGENKTTLSECVCANFDRGVFNYHGYMLLIPRYIYARAYNSSLLILQFFVSEFLDLIYLGFIGEFWSLFWHVVWPSGPQIITNFFGNVGSETFVLLACVLADFGSL